MRLATVVETSRRVTESSRRLEKVDLLANLLHRVAAGEIEAVVAYLSGSLLRQRTGIGFAALREATAPAAEIPTLEIGEDEPQQRRFRELRGLSSAQNLIPHTVTGDEAVAGEFLKDALLGGHEGIMAKSPAAGYAAGARGQSWLKIKRAYTLDLVILAAEWGHGRRQGFLSNLHLGARDTEKSGFAMLGKTFKGLTDEVLARQTEQLLQLELGRDDYTVFVQSKLVAEIAFNDIQMSPRYPAGLALRFARVKRYRGEKTAETADTLETVRARAARYWPEPPP